MRFNPSYLHNNTLALDMSDRSLKLAQVQKKKGKIVLTSHNTIALEEGVLIEGEIKKEDKLREKLLQLLNNPKGAPLTGNQAIACLPESKTFVKLIEVPKDTKELSKEVVAHLLEQHIPVPLNTVYFDWQKVQHRDTHTPQQLLAATIDTSIADGYLSLFESIGLIPTVLEVEAAAIVRALLPFPSTDRDTSLPATLCIDIGATRSSIIVYDNHTLQFTVSVPISAHRIRSIIQETLHLSESQAEKAMIVCGFDDKKGKGAVKLILQKTMQELVHHIQQTISFYYDHFPYHHTIEHVILCGGGANFSGLDAFLTQQLSLTTELGNALSHVQLAPGLTLPHNQARSLTTAIGLSVRSLSTLHE